MEFDKETDFYIETKRNGHTYVDIFNLNNVVKVPEFEKYYSNREKYPKIAYKKWVKDFGKDEVRFFEIAYKVLKEEEKKLDDEL